MKAVTKKALKVHENEVKPAKKTVKAPIVESPNSDRDRLREIGHQLLDKLETAIKLRKPKVSKKNKTDAQIMAEEKTALEQQKDNLKKLFGEKNSYLDALNVLSNMLLKLETPAMSETAHNSISSQDLEMNAADMALVDNFVQRMRGESV